MKSCQRKRRRFFQVAQLWTICVQRHWNELLRWSIYGIHQIGWFEPNHDHSAQLIGVVGRCGIRICSHVSNKHVADKWWIHDDTCSQFPFFEMPPTRNSVTNRSNILKERFRLGGRDYLGDSSGFFGSENETCDRLSFPLVFLAAAWLSTLSTPTRFDDGGQRKQQRHRQQHEEAVVVETSIQEGCSRSSIRSINKLRYCGVCLNMGNSLQSGPFCRETDDKSLVNYS